MCKTVYIAHQCGHTFRAFTTICEARLESNRGCYAFCVQLFNPCRPQKIEDKATSLCHKCAPQRRWGVSGPSVEQMQPTRESMDYEGERTRRMMEGMNRSREREEAQLAKVNQQKVKKESSRRPSEQAQGSRDLTSKKHPSRSTQSETRGRSERHRSDRQPRARKSVQQSQGRSHLEVQTRVPPRPVSQATEQPKERHARESRGVNWGKVSQSKPTHTASPFQTHSGHEPTGFSSNAYHAYWDGRRGVSPLTADDMDFNKHPAVHIPVHDEYPDVRV